MSVAERTRAAVYREPYLLDALRAGVVNYSAAARQLAVDGDEESIATALRRFAAELEPESDPDRRVSVRLRRGVGITDASMDPTATGGDSDGGAPPGEGRADATLTTPDEVLFTVGDVVVIEEGSLAAVRASGDVDAGFLELVLGRLRGAAVDVEAAALGGEDLLVVVGRRSGPETLRLVEDALD